MEKSKEQSVQCQNEQKKVSSANQEIKLRQVLKLDLENTNQIISCQDVISNYPEGFNANKLAYYVPYNFQYKDWGWGCAWRAIQMVLSSYQEDIPNFINLFEKYSRKITLMNIVKKKKLLNQNKQLYQRLNESKFAPQCQENNWAEPFICKIVCEDKRIKNKLFLVNGYPNANAPEYVFQEVVDFTKFVHIIRHHINYSPIMIDDAYFSLTILAFKEELEEKYRLIIGDPHIKSNRNVKQAGIYQIVLDKRGRQIQNDMTAQQFEEGYIQVAYAIDFEAKKWMGLYTCGPSQ